MGSAIAITKPLKLAIVGGGPSAFYVASRLLKLQTSSSVRVHLFDRLWSPHGLVRYGVAPDHPEVKVCGRLILKPTAHLQKSRIVRINSTKQRKTLDSGFLET